MNYYILPKIKNNTLKIKLSQNDKNILSPSVNYFFNLITNQIENDINLFNSIQYINPYIFLNEIDNNDLSYYHLVEIIDTFSFSTNKNILHIGYYNFDYDTVKNAVFNYINKNCDYVFLKKIEMDLGENRRDDDLILYDFLFFNLSSSSSLPHNNNDYVLLILELLYNINTLQEKGGNLILKVNDTYSKPIMELLYILSILYEDKIIIYTPLSSDLTMNERFILCKNFKPCCFSLTENNSSIISQRLNVDGMENERNNNNIISSIYDLYKTINELKLKMQQDTENVFIHSILNTNIPLFYINKLEESNVIIGHYQLDSIYTFINHIKNIQPNKSLQDKIDFIIKTNIQKCIRFCEKYKIEHTFLPSTTICCNNNDDNNIFI